MEPNPEMVERLRQLYGQRNNTVEHTTEDAF